MFVNGVLVDSKINTSSLNIAGQDEGGTSKKYDVMCVTRNTDAFTEDSSYTSCEIWRSEFTDEFGTITTTRTTFLNANSADRYQSTKSTVYDVNSCILRFTFTSLSETVSGILYEGGGTGNGLCVYFHEGILYAQAGVGTLGGNVELSFQNPFATETIHITKNDNSVVSTTRRFTTTPYAYFSDTTGNQAITSTTPVVINFTTFRFGNGDYTFFRLSTTNGSALIIKEGGPFVISVNVGLDISSGTNRSTSACELTLNGTVIPGTRSLAYHRLTNVGDCSHSINTIQDLSVGDELRVQVRRLQGGDILRTQANCQRLCVHML